MGISSSSHVTTRQRNCFPIPAKVVGVDGRLEEFRRRTTAAEVVSVHPGCYLCSSDTMVIDSIAPQLPEDYVLQFDQIYFLMPLSESLSPLSLQDLCVLAIKASSALIGNNNTSSLQFRDGYSRLSCKDVVAFRVCISGRVLRCSSLRVFAPYRKLSSRDNKSFKTKNI